MADACLQAKLAETKAELRWLRERVSVGTPTVHKDLSLNFLIPKFSSTETGIPLEFLSSIEGSDRIRLWEEDTDNLKVAVL
jgi:hypothetical protein